MSKSMTRLLAAALVAVAVPSFASIAVAAPVNGAFAIKNATPSNVESVRYWGGGWRGGWGGWRGGWGRGWGWGGFAAGAVVGGLLAAPYYYGGYSPYYYTGYAPYYYGGGYAPYGGGGYYVDRGGYYGDGGYAGGYRGGYAGGYAGGYGGGGGGGVEYCMQRYRTYDPNSGTFMGNDGRRHPCP